MASHSPPASKAQWMLISMVRVLAKSTIEIFFNAGGGIRQFSKWQTDEILLKKKCFPKPVSTYDT